MGKKEVQRIKVRYQNKTELQLWSVEERVSRGRRSCDPTSRLRAWESRKTPLARWDSKESFLLLRLPCLLQKTKNPTALGVSDKICPDTDSLTTSTVLRGQYSSHYILYLYLILSPQEVHNFQIIPSPKNMLNIPIPTLPQKEHFYTLVHHNQSLIVINKILFIHSLANVSLIETWFFSEDTVSPAPLLGGEFFSPTVCPSCYSLPTPVHWLVFLLKSPTFSNMLSDYTTYSPVTAEI